MIYGNKRSHSSVGYVANTAVALLSIGAAKINWIKSVQTSYSLPVGGYSSYLAQALLCDE